MGLLEGLLKGILGVWIMADVTPVFRNIQV